MKTREREFIRLDRSGQLSLAKEELPALEAGQLYVEVALSGVCSTDEVIVHSRRGHQPLPASLSGASGVASLGHEVIGWVIGAQTSGPVAVIPAERRGPGDYTCMGLSPTAHGAWGTVVIAEDWALIPLPFLAPRFALADSLAPGFALSKKLAEMGRRVVVAGLGPLGLGVLWGLAQIGYRDVVGADPSPQRRHSALRALPEAKVEDAVRIEHSDMLVCALPTSALTADLLGNWARRAASIWCLTHPNSTCNMEWRRRPESNHTPVWLHSPPADHHAAVRALATCEEADEFVTVIDHQEIVRNGQLPDRPADCLRTVLQFKALVRDAN